MHSIAKLIRLRSDLKISVVWFICQIVVGNIVNVMTLFKFLDKPVDLSSILVNLFERAENSFLGSVEKVGVAPDPKLVGPAYWNLEYG